MRARTALIALLVGVVGLALVAAFAVALLDAGSTRAVPVEDEPTVGQRSGVEPAGFVYEQPSHQPLARRPGDRRPNIVLITTDDQALTDMRWMPLTRRWLGDEGVTFTDMISPHPLCCPARAEILTGQFAQNNGVHSNAGPYGGATALRDPDDTIAAWLQDSGYLVGMTGKYLNQYDATMGVPAGWDFWNVATTNRFGYWGFPTYGDGDPGFRGNVYSSDLVRDDTVRLVEEWSAADQPFFVWASYYAPHGTCSEGGGCDRPPVPAGRHADLYPRAKAPSVRKPSFAEPDASDKPPVIGRLEAPTARRATYLHRQRIRSLAAVDQGVDATLRALRRTGELEDTVVLFTSDNGYLVGEHRYVGKILPYEESLRVPLLVRGPGVPAGEVRHQPATTVDLAPTILDLADARPGRLLDGRSLVAYLRRAEAVRPDTDRLVQAGGRVDADPEPWWFRGVRNERWTYVRWHATGFEELYDNLGDPHQLRNLADDPRHRPVVREMARRLSLLEDCAGASCRRSFGAPPRPEPDPS